MSRLLILVILSNGCGPTQRTGNGITPPIGNPPGNMNGSPAPVDGKGAPPTPTSSPDMSQCGGMDFALTRVPPNVMLVLDRSASMSDPINLLKLDITPKYNGLVAAVAGIVKQYGAALRLGDTFFADDDDCSPGVPSAILDNNGQQILDDLNNHSPGSNTPTAATLQAVIDSHKLTDPTRANYVVLATDGMPNCTDTDVVSRINALYNSTPSVKTFVIGIGGDFLSSDPIALNAWADAGHTARSGSTHYYQSTSTADLQAAFNAIAGSVATCEFQMQQSAPDPKLINVTLDGQAVPNDPANGYSYDGKSNSVTLHGTACGHVQKDAQSKVGVVYGCPPPVNPPPIT